MLDFPTPQRSLEAVSPEPVSNVSVGVSSSAGACSVFNSSDMLPLQALQSCLTTFSGAAELGKRLCSSSQNTTRRLGKLGKKKKKKKNGYMEEYMVVVGVEALGPLTLLQRSENKFWTILLSDI